MKKLLIGFTLLISAPTFATCNLIIEHQQEFTWNEQTTYIDLFKNDLEKLKGALEKKGYQVFDEAIDDVKEISQSAHIELKADYGKTPAFIPNQVRVSVVRMNGEADLRYMTSYDSFTYRYSKKSLQKVALKLIEENVEECLN